MGKSVYLTDKEIDLIWRLSDYWSNSGGEKDAEEEKLNEDLMDKMFSLKKK